MSLHAYYHDNEGEDPGHPHHSSRSVSIREHLGSLGITITIIDGPDFEGNARKIAKQQGYPLTEDSTFMWDFNDHSASSSFIRQHAREIGEGSRNENTFERFTIIPDYLAVATLGSFYLDVEDPLKQTWIRSEIPAGTMLRFPAGIFTRLVPVKAKALMFMKAGSEIQVLWGNEAETSHVRQEYLKSLALGKFGP
ncbi:hypothetical protein J3R30DRAFT_3481044 [Lentinula aciculospora]|uniref:Uncharacterized protein n=1 Tax=Lentinula aciculospora TaxID=153920 RepID=A0A9W9DP56_9AGAR|nr:hypothetical protein J3R30DRAFT_3481044 [Lentinula aciculospora]